MMSLCHLKKLLGNLSTFMSIQSVRINMKKDGKENIKIKVNGSQK